MGPFRGSALLMLVPLLAAVFCGNARSGNVERVLEANLIAVVDGASTSITAEFRVKGMVTDGKIDLLESTTQAENWTVLKRFVSNINTNVSSTIPPVNKKVPMHKGWYYCMRLVGKDLEDFTRVYRFENGVLTDVCNQDARQTTFVLSISLWVAALILFVTLFIFSVMAYILYLVLKQTCTCVFCS